MCVRVRVFVCGGNPGLSLVPCHSLYANQWLKLCRALNLSDQLYTLVLMHLSCTSNFMVAHRWDGSYLSSTTKGCLFVCLPRAPDCSRPPLERSFVLHALPWSVSFIPNHCFSNFLTLQAQQAAWALGFFLFPFILSEKWKSLYWKGKTLLFALLEETVCLTLPSNFWFTSRRHPEAEGLRSFCCSRLHVWWAKINAPQSCTGPSLSADCQTDSQAWQQ